jgi:hypothetical protein
VLAATALELALLGEIDEAAAVADKVRARTPKSPGLAWADAAVRLGRGQAMEPAPDLGKPPSAAARLVAARMALASGGAPALDETLRRFGANLVGFDGDLADLSALARAAAHARATSAELGSRAESGNPVAAYVLGRMAARGQDHDRAVSLLTRALGQHGDACAAFGLLVDEQKAAANPVDLLPAARALRERNAACETLKRVPR